MSKKRDTKSLKQEPTIQLSDTPYQGFYAAITAELLILKLHFALKTSSQILNQLTQVPPNHNIPDPEGSVPQPGEPKSCSCTWCGSGRRILMPLPSSGIPSWRRKSVWIFSSWLHSTCCCSGDGMLPGAGCKQKKKKIQGNSIHSLQPQLMELFMS